MPSRNIEKLASILPEAFYDILAYIVPAAYLIMGVLYSLPIVHLDAWYPLTASESWVIDLFLGFIVLGGLYFIGQVITTASFYFIFTPTRWFLTRFSGSNDEKDTRLRFLHKFDEDMVKVRMLYPSIAPEVTKRYARWVFARNIALSSLVLILTSLNSLNWVSLALFGSIFVVAFLDHRIRIRWLAYYIQHLFNVDVKSKSAADDPRVA